MQTIAMPGLIWDSPADMLVILALAALFFGGKKIPEIAKGLGEGIRNFKSAMKDEPEKSEPENKPVALISDGAPEKIVDKA
jgi:sec-independent protein translocase protein TatA